MATKKTEANEEIKLEENTIAEEYVTIRIPRTMEKGEEDKVVWVNDKRYLIKKGVAVTVPMSVKKILEQEEKMLETIYEFESKMAR